MMSQRNVWKLSYSANDLLSASIKRLHYFNKKLDHYTSQQETVIEDIDSAYASNGVFLTDKELVQALKFFATTKQHGAQAKTLQSRYDSTVAHLKSTKSQIDSTKKWIKDLTAILKANSTGQFELDHDDRLYFFGYEEEENVELPMASQAVDSQEDTEDKEEPKVQGA